MDFNYALEKPCEQSSTDEVVGSMEGDSSYAVDGDLKTCSRTGSKFILLHVCWSVL